VLVWLFVPEGTQCVPLEECRYAWQRHWYWGRKAERWDIDLPQQQQKEPTQHPQKQPSLPAAGG
jgi:hypothetical protein